MGPSSARKLSSSDKAALVLLGLGVDLAAIVMAQMHPDEIRRVASALAKLGRVDAALVDAVMAEFHPQLTKGSKLLMGSSQSARRLLSIALGEDALALDKTLDLATPALTQTLSQMDVASLAAVLTHEHPQTTALVLAHLAASKAGELLKYFPASMQVELIERLAHLGPVEKAVLQDLNETLKQAVLQQSPRHRKTLGGSAKVAELIANLDPKLADQLMQKLGDLGGTLAAQVKQQLFQFADLAKIDDRGLRELLKEVPAATLKLALKKAPADVEAAIFRNLSPRAAELLRDDIAALAILKLSDVESAQRGVAELALKLAEAGRLHIPRSGDNDKYV